MMKKCSKCGEEKPATPEYFHRHKKGKYGVFGVCKKCRNKTPILPQPEDYERYGLQPDADIKRCTKCEEFKPATLEYFYKRHKGRYGIRSRCKECLDPKPTPPQPEDYLRFGLKPDDDMKKCTTCEEYKPATTWYFHVAKLGKYGVYAKCRECRNKTTTSPPPQAEDYLRFGLSSSDMIKRCPKCEEWKPATLEFFYRNKGKPSGLCCYCKPCREERYQTDPTYRKIQTLRSSLRQILYGKIKSSRTLDYIGMDKEQLEEYLESKFQPGMTRENHGRDGWHIDHIRPIASFKFEELEGEGREAALHACWHYTNLQPLWAEDNLRKGAKYEPEEFAEVNRDSETTLPDLLCEEGEVSDVPLCLSVEEESADINWAEQG